MSRLPSALLLALALPLPAGAEAVLDPVVVSAARTPVRELNTAASISVIDRAEIEASGARNLAELLRGVAGVQVRDLYGSGARSMAALRGFGENAGANTLVLVDGRRLNNPDLAEPDLNTVSLKDVERIEVVQGGAGVLYGDQAVGGVINIITRPVTGFAADAELSAGSYAYRQLQLSLQDRLDNGLSYRLSAAGRRADHYRDNNEEDYANLFGRLGYRYRSGEAFLEYQWVDEELALPGALLRAQLEQDRRQARYPTDFSDTTTRAGRLGLRQNLTAAWQFEGELAHRQSEIDGVLSGSALEQEREQTGLTPRLVGAYSLAAGELLVTLGVDADDSDYEIRSLFGSTRAEQDLRSLYAQAVMPLSQGLAASVGARRAEADYSIVDSAAFPAGRDFEDEVSVGELGLSWQASPALRWFGRAGGVFRFPKVDELTFSADPAGLQVQEGRSYEAGGEWRRGGAAAKLVVYRLDLDNEIAFDPSAGFFGANSNLDETRRDGLLLEGAWQVLPALRLSAQYGYVDASFEAGSFAGNEVPGVARHSGRLAALYRFAGPWWLYPELIYNGAAYPAGDFANTLEKRPSYSVVNLTLGYAQGPWSGSLRVNNLFDRQYADFAVKDYNAMFQEETGFYPAPERNLLVSVKRAF